MIKKNMTHRLAIFAGLGLVLAPVASGADGTWTDTKPAGITEIRVEAPVRASQAAAWKVLSDYAHPHHYAPGVINASLLTPTERGVGSMRHCSLRTHGGKDFMDERVTDWEEGHWYAYAITRTNLPITNGTSRWSVFEKDGQVMIGTTARYRLRYGLFGRMMNVLFVRRKFERQIRQGLLGMKKSIESGETL